jgi:PAS domain S-box-containing protein
LQVLENLFVSGGFIPHGHCYLWKSELVGLHIASDALIAIAYYSIPITLIYFVRKRGDLPFNWIVWLFGAFIIACGTTHLLEIWTLWHPVYWLSGFIKAITALVSMYTALALIPLVPKALALPSAAQLEKANLELEREITERKLVEKALLHSEERFRHAFDYAAIGMALVAVDGRWLQVNRSLCEIVGYSEQELLATNFQALTHPDDLDTDLDYVNQLLSGEIRHYQMEKRYLHKLGHSVSILLSGSLVRDAQGQPLYFIGEIQDITERKQAEAALRQSEERYLAILEQQTELICRFQPDGTITFVNEAYCRYFGKTREELIGTSYEPIVFEDDLEKIEQLLNTLNLENPVVTIENRVVVNGEVRWTQWNNRAIFGEQGRCVKCQAVGRDITERKQIEEALRESERRFRAIFNNTFQFTGLMAPDGTLLEANQTALDFAGIQQCDTVGKPFWETYWWTISPQTQQELKQAIARAVCGEFMRYEVDVRGAGDIVATIDFSIKPVRDDAGNIILLIPEGRDISDRKRAETERQKAEEKIKASLREKEVLLAEIHHRVKNNLHIISNLLYLQVNRTKDEKVREVLQDSRNRVDSMALVHESLYRAHDFAQINLVEYIKKLSANLLSLYHQRANSTIYRMDSKPDIFVHLDQAIPCGLIANELITNALKHGCREAGNREIFVSLEATSEQQLILIVGNQGNTLPADFNLKTSQSMGLKLVTVLVKQIQGNLEFDRGDFTTFKIKFPIQHKLTQ